MTATERHDAAAQGMLGALFSNARSEEEALVILETVLTGALLHWRPEPRQASEYLDILMEQVIERLGRQESEG